MRHQATACKLELKIEMRGMMMGYQIAITGFILAALMIVIDNAQEKSSGKEFGSTWKTFGGLCIFAVPIGLIIQVWI